MYYWLRPIGLAFAPLMYYWLRPIGLAFAPLMRRFVLCLALASISLSLYGQELTLPLHPGSVRFAVIGDMGTGKPPQYEVAAKMNSARQTFPFDFVIMLGDNIYGGNSTKDYQTKFEMPYKSLLAAGVKFYASLGNHDSTNQRLYKPFNMNGQQYYTYKQGNTQFFVLDSTYMNPQQLSWLEKELQNSRMDWKICYFHHTLYSSGSFHGPATELRLSLEPLFVKYGVQVVFAGHEHVYERTKPQKGITYFIEGAAGELRQGNLKKSDLTASGFDQDHSFILVEISGDELDFQTISRTGKTVDSGVILRAANIKGASPLVLRIPADTRPPIAGQHFGRPRAVSRY
jgi:predicted MPP superfamily phosphohydrolase